MSSGSNTFGSLFQWTSFGESHGPGMGVVIDGCPAGMKFDLDLLKNNLQNRRPGNPGGSERKEMDEPEILSGVFEGSTLGTPIALLVRNQDQRSQDYKQIKNQPRIGHADDLWNKKFSNWHYRGGGRASARETLNWVMAGSVAEMLVTSLHEGTHVQAEVKEVGGESFTGKSDPLLIKKLEEAKVEGESFGAILSLKISHAPLLLGEPTLKKFKGELGRALLLINACVGVEWGDGFRLAREKGTAVHQNSDSPKYGGQRGGITTGEDVLVQLAFKPTASIQNVAKKGRHDPCVALRAGPIAEAMAWNVLADLLLAKRLNNLVL
mgnify:CR=1 FL=1